MEHTFRKAPGYTVAELVESGVSEEQATRAIREARARIDQEDAQHIARQLADYVNVMTFDPAPFVQAMRNVHRTNQQQVMALFLNWCLGLATLEPSQYDARNEFSVELARDIAQFLKQHPRAYVSGDRITLPSI